MENQQKKPIIKDEDSDLILEIKNGRTDLYETLLSKYETRIYNFGLRMCKDVSDAEDLVQETFINIFRYLKDFRMESKFKNWAYKIAASVCMKIKKKIMLLKQSFPWMIFFQQTEKRKFRLKYPLG